MVWHSWQEKGNRQVIIDILMTLTNFRPTCLARARHVRERERERERETETETVGQFPAGVCLSAFRGLG